MNRGHKSRKINYKYDLTNPYVHNIVKSPLGTTIQRTDLNLIDSGFGPFVKDNGKVFLLNRRGPKSFAVRDKVDYASISNIFANFCGLMPSCIDRQTVLKMYLAHAGYMAGQATLRSFSSDSSKGAYCDNRCEKLLSSFTFDVTTLKLPYGIPVPRAKDVFKSKIKVDTHPGCITRAVFNYYKPKKFGRVFKQHALRSVVNDLQVI